MSATADLDVASLAPRVRAPTLVIHSRDDRRAPLAEGRSLATLIPDSRLVVLDSANHILLHDEPAWARQPEVGRGSFDVDPESSAARARGVSG
jgi:pimeloyl-ACP methyl ester carboxylesterase